MTDTFVITGSRPPSARSRSRQSLSRPSSGYKKVSDSSDADELLFSSTHNVPSGTHSINSNYIQQNNAQWAHKVPEVKRDRPLLWAPSSTTEKQPKIYHKPALTSVDLMKNKYRLRKHTPTFVDETLFGPQLEEPSFEAPWGERKKRPKPFMFSSTDYKLYTQDEEMEPYSVDGRPPSRRGSRPASHLTRPCTVESVTSSTKSVWKP